MNYKDKPLQRPRLARGVRYRWDEIRSQHQLLYPEGLLVLNETGAAIIELCDGRSVEKIEQDLANSYSDTHLKKDLHEFLSGLTQRGLVCNDDNT